MKYTKPRIKSKIIKLNYLFSQPRFLDSLNNTNSELAAAWVGDCGGCGSCACGGCGICFIKGTRVMMADGTINEIQKIRSGDEVISYNPLSHTPVKSKVDKLYIHHNSPGGFYIINGTLKATGNHRIWVNHAEWARADQLKQGDRLLNSEGEEIIVRKLEYINGINTVYNLHTRKNVHNYFAENILVHNDVKF